MCLRHPPPPTRGLLLPYGEDSLKGRSWKRRTRSMKSVTSWMVKSTQLPQLLSVALYPVLMRRTSSMNFPESIIGILFPQAIVSVLKVDGLCPIQTRDSRYWVGQTCRSPWKASFYILRSKSNAKVTSELAGVVERTHGTGTCINNMLWSSIVIQLVWSSMFGLWVWVRQKLTCKLHPKQAIWIRRLVTRQRRIRWLHYFLRNRSNLWRPSLYYSESLHIVFVTQSQDMSQLGYRRILMRMSKSHERELDVHFVALNLLTDPTWSVFWFYGRTEGTRTTGSIEGRNIMKLKTFETRRKKIRQP